MGVDIVRLGKDAGQVVPPLAAGDLCKPEFRSYHMNHPQMSIWLMSINPGARIFPWWGLQSGADEDIQNLKKLWSITNEQSLFDCLFLTRFARFPKPHLYAVFSGNIRHQNWRFLKDTDRAVFSKGQSCNYRLEGSYDGKLSINWVPFFSTQSLVKDPDVGSLWRLFGAGAPDVEANSLCMFGLSDPKRLPEVIQILIEKQDDRSIKLAEVVDWFGMFTSPLDEAFGTCAAVYSKNREVISALEGIQQPFLSEIEQCQRELFQDARPRVAVRVVSRHVVL